MAPIPYSGPLPPKKKSELQDIAVALRLSDQGTKDEIQARIKKHLDTNPSLEDNPNFSGLYGRKRRSVQPLSQSVANPKFPSSEKPHSSAYRITPLDPIRETTPTTDLRDVSTFLKHPISSADITPNQSPLQDIYVITPSSLPPLPPSPSKSLIEHISRPTNVRTVVQRIQQQEFLPNGTEFLEATRAFLSSSRNIWTLTALFEILYILQTIIPWKMAQLPLSAQGGNGFFISFPYPPLSVFQASTFWMVLFHWAIPTLVVPALLGTLISFNAVVKAPSSRTSNERYDSIAPFDPLTAAIVRLAVSIAYPYETFASKGHVFGLDVLGFNLRVLNAAVGLAFAFAEAIADTPKLFATSLVREQRLLTTFANRGDGLNSDRRVLTADDDTFGAEVD